MLNKKGWLILAVFVFGIQAVVFQDKYFEIIKNMEIYTNVYKELNKSYVDEIDPSELMRTGVDAMVKSLDPFTNYISSTQVEQYRIQNQGRYEGLGIKVIIIDGEITVAQIIEGSPANLAGVEVADRIVQINNEQIKGLTLDEVNKIMEGSPKSNLEFIIQRPGEKDEKQLIVSRDEYNISNVPVAELVKDDFAYINLTTFTENATSNIRSAITKLKKENPSIKGIILDLRNNGGGLLKEAIGISNLFVEKDSDIVATKGKIVELDKNYKAMLDPYDPDTPIAVLINDRSASASEIVSGVIQDYDRGILIGQRSYGKGLVQQTVDVGYSNKIKLTTAKYYIPSGRCIQSVRYENGEPVTIPKEERTAFKTKNNRTVYDGGGVAPDVIMDRAPKIPLIEALNQQHMIFKYVTQYLAKNPTIEHELSYAFTEYDAFLSFLKKNDFKYVSKGMKTLMDLETELIENGLDQSTNKSLLDIKNQIATFETSSFEKHKNEIIDAIEEEIITRKFFEKGRIRRSLNEDVEINKAIQLLSDKEAYTQIISK